MTEPIKLCKDCRYMGRNIILRIFGSHHLQACHAPESKRSPVTGQTDEFADISRKFQRPDCCGPDAKWFEPV